MVVVVGGSGGVGEGIHPTPPCLDNSSILIYLARRGIPRLIMDEAATDATASSGSSSLADVKVDVTSTRALVCELCGQDSHSPAPFDDCL